MLKILNKLKYNKQYLASGIGSVIIINMILAILALLKDIMLASYMGTSAKADALLLAFFIPDMIGNNLLASAIGTSSIPIFSKIYVSKEKSRLSRIIVDINICVLIVSAISSIFIFIFRKEIIDLLGIGFSLNTKLICYRLLMIIMPTILLYPIISIGISIMQVFEQFLISSLIPVLFNFVFLIGVVYCYVFDIPVDQGVYIIAYSILGAIVAMTILVYATLVKEKKIRFITPSFTVKNEDFKYLQDIFKLFIPYFLMVFLSQDMLYFERYLASAYDEGSVAALNYAYRLSQFPIWIFISAIGTVIFPLMSKWTEKGEIIELKRTFDKAIWFTIVIILPLTIMIYVLRIPIITVLFKRYTFDEKSVMLTAEILKGYCLAILGQSITALCLKFFLSKRQIGWPIVIVFVSGSFNIWIDFCFIKTVGIASLGYGAAIGSLFSSISLLYLIKCDTSITLNKKTLELIKLLAVNIMVVISMSVFNDLWNIYVSQESFVHKFLYIFIVFLVTSILYFKILKKSKAI